MSVSGAGGRVEPAGSGTAADRGFGVVHVAADGTERRVSLAALAAVRLEDGRPVRSFPSYRGQRNYPGWYWSATMGRRIGFESWVERDHLVALDFDPAVTAVASQPFWLLWQAGDKVRRHAPDFFARLAGGGALVVDSRPLDRIGERDREAFAAAGEACARLGWQYAVWGSAGPVPAANLRWLAGYRHPRCHDEPAAARLREAFARPRALMDGAEMAGDPLAMLPVLFHLMWRHELAADLSLVLSDRSILRSAAAGMAERPGVLRVGDRVLFGGGEHQVVGLAGNAVRLLAVSGQAAVVALPFLLAAPDFAIVGTGTAAAALGPRLTPHGLLDALPEHVARAARDWERHLIEVLTGVPPDAPDGAAPRPEYDLARPLAEREQAKAAELTAAGVKASARTVRRMRYRYREQGLWGLVDTRHAPAARPAGNVDPRVVAAAAAVIDAQAGTSTGTRGRVIRQVIDRLEAEHGPGVVPVPSRATFYRLLAVLPAGRHTFGSAVTRRQTAGRPGGVFTATIAARPGEQVQMDGTPLDVMAVMDDGVIGRPELVAAVDVATRTICAAVLRPVGAKAVDAALLLARMMVPEPMRPGWDQALAMSASRIPYRRLVSIDTRLELAAAKPVIVPDTVVIDHGKVFLSEVFLRAADTLGLSVQPAHEQTGSDKAVMERTFGSINTLFCQHVAGYTGRDVTRRGTDVADRAVWSLADLQELLDEWIICWQSRPHEGLRHPFTPDRAASPNEVYAALVAAAGYVPVALTGEDYIELLPAQWRSIGDGGIQIDYRTCNCAELAPYRRLSSGLAAREGRWEVHHDPYDLTRIWVRNHHHGGWITVPWTHLAVVTQPFADFTWRHARKIAAQRGVDDANETAVALVLAGLLRRAGQGPDTQRTLARTRAAAALPGLRPALPAPEPDPEPAALPEPQAAEPATCEEGTSPEAGAATVAGFGLFDPFGEQDGEDR